MQSLFPVLLLTISPFILARPLDDDYVDDNYFLTNGVINSTDEYPLLASQLNCSEFLVRHEGVKTEEVLSKPNRLLPKLATGGEDVVKTLYVEDAEDDGGSPENDSTEKPIKSGNKENERKMSKRAVVTVERYWTAENISIIDGYSKVAIYPMPDHKFVKRKTTTEKMTAENETSECTAPFDDDADLFNWYEVIVENGGPPGKVNATRLTPNMTEILEPCHRPITTTLPPLEDLLYEFEFMDFEKVHRNEQAFLRFAETPSEFIDVIGELVWAPQDSVPRYYRVSYRKDDTGFYVNVRRRQKCVFEKDPMTVKCEQIDDYTPCETMELDLEYHTKSLAVGLQAALIG